MCRPYLYLSTMLIAIIVSAIPSNEIPKPQHRKIQSSPPQQVKIQRDQTVQIKFPNFGYIAGLKAKERINIPKVNLASAYQERNSQFASSKSCDVIDPQINMKKQLQIIVDSAIIQHFTDKQSKLLFIATQKDFRIYQLASFNITLAKQFEMIDGFNKTKITIIKLDGKMYCTNGTAFYQFQNYRRPFQSSLVFWTNVPKDQALNSLNITDKHLTEIKIINIGTQHLLFLYQHFFIIYYYNPVNKILAFFPNKYTLDQIKMKQGFFVDVIHDNTNLYLLNLIMGIVELVHFHPNDPAGLSINHYIIQYDELLKMKKFGSVFEIICKYRKKTFVAEMLFETRVGKKREMILNRFYDKVDGVNDVEMFNQHLHIYGEDEVYLYGPAINRFTLYSEKEYPYIFTNHGIQIFTFLTEHQKVHQTMQIVGITQYSIAYLQVKTEQLSLKCKPHQNIQLRLSVIGSCCEYGVCQEDILTVCEYLQDLEITISNTVTVVEALLIIGGVILILIILGIVFLGCFFSRFVILRDQINKLKERIWSKKEQTTNMDLKDMKKQQAAEIEEKND